MGYGMLEPDVEKEWIVRLVQWMYANAQSHVHVGEGYSEEFEVKVGVHQGWALSRLLFIIVLEASLGSPGRTSMPMTLLSSLIHWRNMSEGSWRKEVMEEKRLRVNSGKTKIMICGMGLNLLQSSGKFPCAACHTGVGSNSIFCNGCNGCKHWVHKKCNGLEHLTKDPDYRCTWCQGTARPLDGRPQREVQIGPDKLEVVASFCYLGDMLSAASGCELSTTAHVKTAWKKFKELLPFLSSRHLSFKTCGRVYSSYVWSTMLHASETWPLTKQNLQHLQRNNRTTIRQICSVMPQDIVNIRSNELFVLFCIEDLDLILKERRPHWYGHVEHPNSAVKTACDIQVDGKCGPGRPKMTRKQLTERDHIEWRLSILMIDTPGDQLWDLPCMQQSSYLEGGPLMWMLPLHLHFNKKICDDDDNDDFMSFSWLKRIKFCQSVSSIKFNVRWGTDSIGSMVRVRSTSGFRGHIADLFLFSCMFHLFFQRHHRTGRNSSVNQKTTHCMGWTQTAIIPVV